jgi:hypothetical protein
MADMLFTDRALQESYRALMQDNAALDHVGEATWDRLVAERIAPEERDALFDHVVGCERCARIWRGILALKGAAEADGLIEVDAPAAPGWRSWGLPAAVAAMLVIAAAGLLITQRSSDDPSAVRATATVAAIDSLMMGYDVAGTPTFVWSPVAGATRNHVEVFSADGLPVWSQDFAAPPARWPAEAPRRPGAYRWRVSAYSSGGMLARSALTPVEISR